MHGAGQPRLPQTVSLFGTMRLKHNCRLPGGILLLLAMAVSTSTNRMGRCRERRRATAVPRKSSGRRPARPGGASPKVLQQQRRRIVKQAKQSVQLCILHLVRTHVLLATSISLCDVWRLLHLAQQTQSHGYDRAATIGALAVDWAARSPAFTAATLKRLRSPRCRAASCATMKRRCRSHARRGSPCGCPGRPQGPPLHIPIFS